jgi:hypothetical protein
MYFSTSSSFKNRFFALRSTGFFESEEQGRGGRVRCLEAGLVEVASLLADEEPCPSRLALSTD